MPVFFAHARGTVKRIGGAPGATVLLMPFHIVMQDIGIGSGFTQARAIITQAGVVQNGNFQFLHTLNETIYAYVFGDRIGELRVSGVAFSKMCDFSDTKTGMKQVLDTYEANKFSKLARPILIDFGDTPFKGFLTGMNLDVSDAESMLGQWAFRFNTFPGRQQ